MKKWISILAISFLGICTSATVFAQTKKNGTKDMRYKANKKHLKKDGTVDKRYK